MNVYIAYYVTRKQVRSYIFQNPQVCFTHAVQLAAQGVKVIQEIHYENPGDSCCICYDRPVTHVDDLEKLERDLRYDH
jgi:hypothetical protein